MTVYPPESWDCPIQLRQANRTDHAAIFVGRLFELHQSRGDPGADRGFPMYSRFLRTALGRNYDKTVAELVEAGHVNRPRNHRVGSAGSPGNSREYRLAEELLRDPRNRPHQIRHRELLKPLGRPFHDAEGHPNDHWQAVHHQLRQQLDRVEVAGDAPLNLSIPLRRLHDRQPYFTVCRMGRVHSPVTNLARSDRKYLRFRGQPLWQADVKTSQPLLNAIAARLDEIPRPIAEYARQLDPTGDTNRTGHVPLTAVQAPAKTMVGSGSDLDEFLNLCLSGDLYDEFRVWNPEAYDYISRDSAKDLLLPAFLR